MARRTALRAQAEEINHRNWVHDILKITQFLGRWRAGTNGWALSAVVGIATYGVVKMIVGWWWKLHWRNKIKWIKLRLLAFLATRGGRIIWKTMHHSFPAFFAKHWKPLLRPWWQKWIGRPIAHTKPQQNQTVAQKSSPQVYKIAGKH